MKLPNRTQPVRRRRRQATLGLAAVLLVLAHAAGAQAAGLKELNRIPAVDPHRVVAIVGGRLLDGRGGEPIESATVILRGASIVAAGSRREIEIPAGAERVDAEGLSILPGLIDSHLHTVNDLKMPALVLSHGVTSFRDPGHPLRFYQALLQTKQTMPRAFLTGSHLDAYPPIWPQQAIIIESNEHAREWVTRHVKSGASAVKIYFRLPLEHYAAVCRTAEEFGIPVVAHLELVDADDAIRAGIDGVEHITSFGTALADETLADEFRDTVAATPSARRDMRYRLWAGIELDPAKNPRVTSLLNLIVEHNVVVSPTLAVFERQVGDRDATEVHTHAFQKMLRFTGMCHLAGAKVVVGSHTWAPHAEPGWAYVRELELLVQAGLTPIEAIRAGTLYNAQFFRAEDRLGTIEPGKTADLVLIRGKPDADILNMKQVERVMLGGIWVSADR